MQAQVIEIPYFFIFLQRVDRLMERACAVLVISMPFLPRASRISLRSFSCLESDFERVTFSKGACQDLLLALRLVLSEESINVVSSTFHFFHPDFRPDSYRPNRNSHRILLTGNTAFKLRSSRSAYKSLHDPDRASLCPKQKFSCAGRHDKGLGVVDFIGRKAPVRALHQAGFPFHQVQHIDTAVT